MRNGVSNDAIFYAIVIAISFLAPLVSYAGVSLIYPNSTLTSNVNTSPPITWAQGDDYSRAVTHSFAGSFSASDSAAAFTLTVSGLSGGQVTVDKLLNLTAVSGVTTYKVKISSALTGALTSSISTLKMRFWTGATAPTGDGSSGVLAVLDLKAALDTETSTTISGGSTVYVQLVYQLASSSSGTATVSIQPSSITLS